MEITVEITVERGFINPTILLAPPFQGCWGDRLFGLPRPDPPNTLTKGKGLI